VSRIGRSSLSTRGLSAAQTPIAIPNTTAMPVATSTCEAVSMAGSQTPMTPIRASMRNVVIAGRSPLSTYAIAVRQPSTMNQGVSISRFWTGWSIFSRMKLPTGSVMLKTNEVGSWM
jgi:hypothetical protein